MYHFVITGHSQFSVGLYEAVEMIAGELDNLEAIPFLAGESATTYENKIKKVYEENNNKKLVFFTDLLGGTPYKTSVEQKIALNSDSEIISGSNLALILEAVTLSEFIEDSKQLCEMAVNSGKDNITLFELNLDDSQEELEDGI